MAKVVSSTGRLPNQGFWGGRRVLLTGHTGFKGSWLARWLAHLGSEVVGFALDPPTEPSVFEVADVRGALALDLRGDLRDVRAVADAVDRAEPDVVLHLAAQPLVRDGYRDPAGTFSTNVSGTANLLSALLKHATERPGGAAVATVVVTTDKVYLPKPDGSAHREGDPLGGSDPYSLSKAMVESLVGVMARLPPIDGRPGWTGAIATARAGNVLGGGDWSSERLVPDCVRAFAAGEPVALRLPRSVRPWQHVLEPLCGYLLLAEELSLHPDNALDAVNFGPNASDEVEVEAVAGLAAAHWGDAASVAVDEEVNGPHEVGVLRLDSRLAAETLGWVPRWDVGHAIGAAVEWHRAHLRGARMSEVTDAQIHQYSDG